MYAATNVACLSVESQSIPVMFRLCLKIDGMLQCTIYLILLRRCYSNFQEVPNVLKLVTVVNIPCYCNV